MLAGGDHKFLYTGTPGPWTTVGFSLDSGPPVDQLLGHTNETPDAKIAGQFPSSGNLMHIEVLILTAWQCGYRASRTLAPHKSPIVCKVHVYMKLYMMHT